MKELPRKHMTSRRGRRGFELAPECLNDTSSITAFLRTRRSAEPALIGAPGPDAEQLAILLETAARVPDHGKMEPWRFIVLRDAPREAFARLVKARWMALNPGEEPDKRAQYDLIARIPLIIVVVSRAREHPKIPKWEQYLSAGASCMALVTAATAMGLGAQWRSSWMAEDEEIMRALGLEEEETIAGFVFIGALDESQPRSDRRRPYWRDLTTFWEPPAG